MGIGGTGIGARGAGCTGGIGGKDPNCIGDHGGMYIVAVEVRLIVGVLGLDGHLGPPEALIGECEGTPPQPGSKCR